MLNQNFSNFVTLQAGITGGGTPYHLPGGTVSSTNATLVSAGAHTLLGGFIVNTSANLGYLRFYDSATVPSASSSTNAGFSVPIPASTTGAGVLIHVGTYGVAFSNGLAFVVTGGGNDNDASNAPIGIFVNLVYK